MSRFIFLSIIYFCLGTSSVAQGLAFPGAEGGGKFATGGRGGKILFVTNLNDQGEGSFREAIESSGPRTILFAVAGTIHLQAPIEINHGDLTIAGQSAPGEGICITGYPVKLNADNIIVRFMRFRLGDQNKVQDDAFGGTGHSNIIIDHCSVSWATDECASFYRNHNTTFQWSIISESLNKSVHEKGEHGYGAIWGGVNASFHHNLFAHHKSRNPRFDGGRFNKIPDLTDFRNNVIYNWGINSIYGGENSRYNIVNNYFKPGPATGTKVAKRIVNITTSETYDYGVFYVEGNAVEGAPEVTKNNWNGGVDTDAPSLKAVKSKTPFPVFSIKEQSANEAYSHVLAHAGASLMRDKIDRRIVEEVRTGTASFGKSYRGGKCGIIDSPDDVGGLPELLSGTPITDNDRDGMDDQWEADHGLNPLDGNDHHNYSIDSQYTNIELYLNSIVKDIIK